MDLRLHISIAYFFKTWAHGLMQITEGVEWDGGNGVVFSVVGVVPVQPADEGERQDCPGIEEEVADAGTSCMFRHANEPHKGFTNKTGNQPVYGYEPGAEPDRTGS